MTTIAERLTDARSRAMSPVDDIADRASAETSALQIVDGLLARYPHRPGRALLAIELSRRFAKLEHPRRQLDELLSEVERLHAELVVAGSSFSPAAMATVRLLLEEP